ncbi:hypothetical protein [Mucilaginibacter sp.]|uniref:hypothetical protein n=1 Tax=Mucilaginibacter sp. TaxID=1882438 RepID=UPI00262CAB43|nr:hypothetical protein [Mucilaginibacter sp.]MDB4926692.1 hypothetical protein [Mucilaginibacter sp.]
MKRLFLLVLVMAELIAFAQPPFIGKAFYCPSFKRKFIIQIKNDTLYTQNTRYDAYPADPEMKQKLYFLRKQDGFSIYVVVTEHKVSMLGSRIGNTYALVGYKLLPDGEKLNVAYETHSHTSLEECKELNFDPGARFTLTYFSKAYYDKFSTLKPVKDVDSLTTIEIYSRLKQQMMANQERIRRFGATMYATVESWELLTRILLAMQLNPIISEEEFNRYTEKYVVGNRAGR